MIKKHLGKVIEELTEKVTQLETASVHREHKYRTDYITQTGNTISTTHAQAAIDIIRDGLLPVQDAVDLLSSEITAHRRSAQHLQEQEDARYQRALENIKHMN